MTSKRRRLKREKQRKAWGFYGRQEWLELRKRALSKFGRVCMCCGKTPKHPNVDHVIPRSLRPDLALLLSNLQVLCWPCNKAKGTNTWDFRIKAQR